MRSRLQFLLVQIDLRYLFFRGHLQLEDILNRYVRRLQTGYLGLFEKKIPVTKTYRYQRYSVANG